MIREATVEDIPKLVAIAEEYNDHSLLNGLLFEEQSVIKALNLLISDENSIVFVNEFVTGAISGAIHPFWGNEAKMMCSKIFWWCMPEAKAGDSLALWTRLEDWAIENKASFLQIAALDAPEPNRIKKLFSRKGYVPVENVYMKRF